MIDPKHIGEYVKSFQAAMQPNEDLLDIYDGNLAPHVLKDLEKQMSPRTFNQAKFRLSPINILPKIIDKLTNIYQTTVIRTVEAPGVQKDQEILDWYVKEGDVNATLNCANEMFNLTGATLIQPLTYDGKPFFRVVPVTRYALHSDDKMRPDIPTQVMLCYKQGEKDLYWVYTKDEIYAVDAYGNIQRDLMAETDNIEGVNPIEALTFTYINSSKYKLVPTPDVDALKIIKLLPVMLSDLNYAAMYQCFSILYGINVDEQDMTLAPNTFMRFKQDATNPNKPEIGVIKPTVDYPQVLELIQSQLSMWLGTKGIRSSSVGSLNPDNFTSGISKVIDEMDTYEAREKQVKHFMNGEQDLWDLVLKKMHPYWLQTGQIKDVGKFNLDAEISTKFTIQLPIQTRGAVVKDLQLEVASGFTTRARAIATLNPQLNAEQILELVKEIEEERNGVAEDQPGNTNDPETESEDTASGSDS